MDIRLLPLFFLPSAVDWSLSLVSETGLSWLNSNRPSTASRLGQHSDSVLAGLSLQDLWRHPNEFGATTKKVFGIRVLARGCLNN